MGGGVTVQTRAVPATTPQVCASPTESPSVSVAGNAGFQSQLEYPAGRVGTQGQLRGPARAVDPASEAVAMCALADRKRHSRRVDSTSGPRTTAGEHDLAAPPRTPAEAVRRVAFSMPLNYKREGIAFREDKP